ncbi:MAG TPA: zf-HC2 domain-containing protein [Synechococcales cyanobacterium M55_K2018_004]|nr:zf-HC2 domain-containing protein [Synechococcales cyanobacterium M55_K2018_004]
MKPTFDGAGFTPEQIAAAAEAEGQKRDRFELLSAYLDGEVTPEERRQVDQWLTSDADIQTLYSRLLKLRQGMRSLAVPGPAQPTETTVQTVLTRLERKPKRIAAWGGMAIAALFVGVLTPMLMPLQRVSEQVAVTPSPDLPSEGLMIALDRPVVDIPHPSSEGLSQKNLHKLHQTTR